MLFKILTDTSTFYYDSMTNTISDSNKNPIDLSYYSMVIKHKPENRIMPFDFSDDQYPYPKKDKLIKQLKIQLGTNCNQHCAYCIQAAGNYKTTRIPNKEDISKFFTMIDESGIQLVDYPKIHFWGGEPLVYWKNLLILIPEIRKRWPNAKLWFVSNGTLINQNKLDFLIDNSVELAFSHDGTTQSLRGYNPFDDLNLLKMWQTTVETYQKNQLAFRLNTVLNEHNADLFELDRYFVNYLGSDIYYKYEDVVIAHSPNAVQFTKFSKQAEQTLCDSVEKAMCSCAVSASTRISNALYDISTDFIRKLVYRVPVDAIRAKCNAIDPDVLSVDLMTGDILSCHNVTQDWTMGSLLDYNNIKVDKFRHWSLRQNCPTCPYLSVCKGSCARNSDELHKHSCNGRIVLSKAVFNAVFKILFNCKVKEIMPYV